jgi:transposase
MRSRALSDAQWARVQPFLPWRAYGRKSSTRFEKTGRNFLALVHVACSALWLA